MDLPQREPVDVFTEQLPAVRPGPGALFVPLVEHVEPTSTADPDGCPGRHVLEEPLELELEQRRHLEVPAYVVPPAPAPSVWFEPPLPLDAPAPVGATPPPEVLADAAQLLAYAGRAEVARWVEGWATAGARG